MIVGKQKLSDIGYWRVVRVELRDNINDLGEEEEEEEERGG